MVSLLPEAGHGYYIYFRPGTTEQAIEEFHRSVLTEPRSARSYDLIQGVRSIIRITPVGGREVIAIGLEPSLTSGQKRDLRSRIESQSVVAEVADHPL